MEQNYINHIAFVIDKSGSIRNSGLENSVVRVFDSQIKHLQLRSKELNQDTRVSVYLFNQKVNCLFFDIDVNKIPSLAKYYNAEGDTAMIDSMLQALSDLSRTNTLYGDHAFLVYCLTDGENRINNNLSSRLNKAITSLPENYTVAALVPDQDGVFECKKFGFPQENIKIWQTTVSGVSEVGNSMIKATDSYMVARNSGLRSTRNLFTLDASNLDSRKVKNNLEELRANEYELYPVQKDIDIKSFVESWTRRNYIKGSTYYLLTKPETLQDYKQILIQNKRNGKVYGGANARKLLGLPNYEVKVNPASYGDYDIFAQSTSSNRKLIRGTKVIVMK